MESLACSPVPYSSCWKSSVALLFHFRHCAWQRSYGRVRVFSAGIGRTGVLITMETAMYLIEANQPVYPLTIVRQMRDQRAMLIQTSVSHVSLYLHTDDNVFIVSQISHYLHADGNVSILSQISCYLHTDGNVFIVSQISHYLHTGW